jgi:predicted dehydrogenase
MNAYRAGIVGAGLMGRWHAHAIKKTGAQVAAVADSQLAAAERLAASHSGARPYSNFEQMLDQARLDALHICTPLETHNDIAERAIRAGLHLLIEKPITPHALETEQLYDLAADRNVVLCPVHQFLFQEGTLKAVETLPRIGRLIHIKGMFCSAGGAGQPAARLDEIAADILPHPLALMQIFLSGRLVEAKWRTAWPAQGEIRVAGECNRVTLEIFVSMNTRPTVCAMQLFGAEGTIHLDLFHGYAVVEPGEVSRARKILHPFDLAIRTLSAATGNLANRVIRRQPAYPGLQRLVSEFYRAVQTGTEPPISAADAIAVARIRDYLIQPNNAAIAARIFNRG